MRSTFQGFGSTIQANRGSAPKPSATPSSYFVDTKKGEVNELKQLLKKTLNEKDNLKRRDVVKKVIAFMTLGVDVSRLFSEMCMASYTTDLIQKKMIYLYLGNYAETNPDLAILAINTFLVDFKNQDSKIRGLALRSLCHLKFEGLYEYLQPAIMESLRDMDPYVKKTGILGTVKLFYMKPEIVKSTNIIDLLYQLIRDPDTLVASNAINALNEILQDEGGIAINSKIIIYLLNKIKEFNEWGQCIILELVSKYQTRSENELFDIMNILDDRLKHSSSAIVLGCIKIFLNFTKNNPLIHKQVYERIQPPLITMMISGEVTNTFELTYIILTHIYFIVTRGGNEYFERDFKHFYCKIDEPTYIKHLKLNILKNIASEQNLGDILNELSEYVGDVDTELSKQSIRAIGGIALRLQKTATPIIKSLASFMNIKQDHITNETIIAFKDILRKYKDEYKEVIPILETAMDYITEPEAKAAVIWILGEFGEHIDDSPYILEKFINSVKDETNVEVKQILLKATVQLFVKRPGEVYDMLRRLITAIIENENQDYDLRDRAYYYCSFLQNNLNDLQKLLEGNQEVLENFIEDAALKEEGATLEFNTLSVVFQKPTGKFIKSLEFMNQMKNREANENEEANPSTQQAQAQVQVQGGGQGISTPTTGTPSHSVDNSNLYEFTTTGDQQQSNQNGPSNLLDMDFGGNSQPTEITIHSIAPFFDLDVEYFQSQWLSLQESANLTRVLSDRQNLNEAFFDYNLPKANIFVRASGEQGDEIKFYLYARHIQSDAIFYMEMQINTSNMLLNLIIKSENDEIAPYFAKYVEQTLREWGMF